jgi:hypothetical protein
MDSHTLTDMELRRHLIEIHRAEAEMKRGVWQTIIAAVAAAAALIGAGIAVAPAFYQALHSGHVP